MATSGVPTEAQVQDQWRKAVNIIDITRTYADSLLGASSVFEGLGDVLKGDYTVDALASWMSRYRAGLSTLVDPGFYFEVIAPCIQEYGKVLQLAGSEGNGYENIVLLKSAIYDHFVANSLSVETRAITYDTSATAGAGNAGNGAIARVTTDENGFAIEDCHVETKVFKCRRDQNSGVRRGAEVFEMLAEVRSPDNLEYDSFGSGTEASAVLEARNAGNSSGGSLLRNSSFSNYDAAADNVFANWVATGAVPVQTELPAEVYETFPGASLDASLKVTGDFKIVQSLANMRTTRLDPNTPYFLRVMVNATEGTALGGTITVRMGSDSFAVAVATVAAAGDWYELVFPFTTDSAWLKSFNQDGFTIEIERSGSTSGYLVLDDMIFCSFTKIDGTWWVLRQNAATPTPWIRDDTLTFSDTNTPSNGKLNYALWRAGLGYLPSSGSPTFLDP